MFAALVTKYHHAVVVPAFVKSECAEVHPCAASYLLVHLELRDASIVKYKIFGIAYAARQCLVRYVYSIFSRFRNIGYPFGKSLVFLLFSFGKACRAGEERVFIVLIDSFPLGKSGSGGLFPTCFPAFHVQIKGTLSSMSAQATVIVYDDFLLLRVPFAGSEYIGSCILQHGQEVGQDEGLGELVFCSAEQPRALPSPFVLVIDIIFPVALPKGDVASFQSAGDVVGARGTGYPGGTFVFQVAEQACLVFLPFPVEVGDKLFDALPVSKDGEVEIVHRSWQDLSQMAVNGINGFRP